MKRGLDKSAGEKAKVRVPEKSGVRVRSRGERAVERGDTKRALVWCGTELLTERGFQVTGIDEVLKRVGVPKGSFYHFFANKHEFGEAVIQNYVDYYARKMNRIFDDEAASNAEVGSSILLFSTRSSRAAIAALFLSCGSIENCPFRRGRRFGMEDAVRRESKTPLLRRAVVQSQPLDEEVCQPIDNFFVGQIPIERPAS